MEYNTHRFRFCPSCGSELTVTASQLKFCPYCGARLVNTAVETVKKTLDKNKYSRPESQQSALYKETDCYSVMLIACPHKDSLARRLEKLLLRSNRAIRMALETSPCYIIYKGKTATMAPIVSALVEEKAVIAVIPGEAGDTAPLEGQGCFRRLSPGMQSLLRSVNKNLWIGQTLYRALSCRLDGQPGVLAVTGQFMAFIPEDHTQRQHGWLVVPYYLLEDVYYLDNRDDDSGKLEIVYKYGEPELGLTAAHDSAEELYDVIQQAMAEGRSQFGLRKYCPKCQRTLTESVFAANLSAVCEGCGARTEQNLVFKRQ